METAIVVSEQSQQVPLAQSSWGRERVDLIKRTICPKGISDDEFSLFIEQCKRSGLDPLLKEAFCVPRRQNVGSREKPNWINKHEFQPSEAGMLARAERFPDFKGIQASAAYAEDELLIDQGKGEVIHRFNPAKRKGQLVGAWARVVRDGKLPVVVWLDFSGYVQQTPLWSKIPTTMIEKCARVAALRKAYPEAFGGLYVREEMPAEEYEQPVPAVEPRALAAGGAYEVLEPTIAQSEKVSIGAEALHAELETKETPPPPAPRPITVAIGPAKGRPILEVSDEELKAAIGLAHEKLVEQPKAKWAKAVRENLAALEAERERRATQPKKEQRKPLTIEEAERVDRSTYRVGVGEWAGKFIADLSVEEIQAAGEYIEGLLKSGKPQFAAAKLKDTLLLLGLEMDKRMSAAGVAPIA